MAAGRKSGADDWITEDGLLQIKGWARDGLSDKEIANEKIGIAENTFCLWKNKHPAIVEALKKGRAPVLVQVEDTFHEKKLQGYFVDEEVTEITISKDSDGREIGRSEHKRVSKRYIPPDTTAMIFYMKCRMSDKYNDRINLMVDDKRNGKLADLIAGLKEDDLHTETASTNEAVADEPAETN
jgi:hypothetical protein